MDNHIYAQDVSIYNESEIISSLKDEIQYLEEKVSKIEKEKEKENSVSLGVIKKMTLIEFFKFRKSLKNKLKQ